MSKENIFISYVHSEEPLAQALKYWLERTTAGQWSVFVAGAPESILPGEQWFARIEDAQTSQQILLVLCSPVSMARPWIHYEVGYAAAKSVPILPLRHSGLTTNALPSFIARYQGIDLNANGFVKKLFNALQKHVPLRAEPYIPEPEITNAIQDALTQIAPLNVTE